MQLFGNISKIFFRAKMCWVCTWTLKPSIALTSIITYAFSQHWLFSSLDTISWRKLCILFIKRYFILMLICVTILKISGSKSNKIVQCIENVAKILSLTNMWLKKNTVDRNYSRNNWITKWIKRNWRIWIQQIFSIKKMQIYIG